MNLGRNAFQRPSDPQHLIWIEQVRALKEGRVTYAALAPLPFFRASVRIEAKIMNHGNRFVTDIGQPSQILVFSSLKVLGECHTILDRPCFRLCIMYGKGARDGQARYCQK